MITTYFGNGSMHTIFKNSNVKYIVQLYINETGKCV